MCQERREDMSSFREGQTHQLMDSLEEKGFTSDLITKLGQFDDMPELIAVLNGESEIVPTKYIVDLDADPMIPDGWEKEEHTKGGQFEFDPKQIALYLDEQQQAGGVILGNNLRKKLEGKGVYNANLLDFYLANPQLIPEEWKGKSVFFWGTIYRRSRGVLCVRYLYWSSGMWRWYYRWLDPGFDGHDPAVISASN
jgi:hypothetical protein